MNHNRLAKRVGIPAAATGAFVLGIVGLSHESHSDDSYRKAEIAKVTQADSEFLLLNSGVNMRSTPAMVNDGNSGDNNIVFKVPEGKQVLVRLPVKSEDKPGWVGFYNPSSDQQAANTDNLVWVNLGQLREQDGTVQEFAYGKSDNVDVHVDHGKFTVDGNPDVPVAQAALADAGGFDAELPKPY